MNFLLHLRLTEIAALPPAGAIIGDVLRGRLDPALPEPLARSIALHRRIDALSDRHPALSPIKVRFAPAARRYAGIVLDLVCDHVAANGWPAYGVPDEPLPAFARRMAAAVADEEAWRRAVDQAAPRVERFASLLTSYGDAAGVDRAIQRIAERLRSPTPFLEAAAGWRETIDATASALPEVFTDLAATARGFADAPIARSGDAHDAARG